MRSMYKLTANLCEILAGIQPAECKVNMTIDVERKGLSTISQDIHNGMIFLHATAISIANDGTSAINRKKIYFQ
jgi:hypothetical protein